MAEVSAAAAAAAAASRGSAVGHDGTSPAGQDTSDKCQLVNPPFVHCLTVPDVSSNCRPWCQLVGVARGDGGVLVCDPELGFPAPSTSASQSSTSTPSQRSSKQRAAAASQQDQRAGGGTAGGDAYNSSSDNKQGSVHTWSGPRLWSVAHTRPAAAAAFSSAGVHDNKAAPAFLVSGGEDRQLLVWSLQSGHQDPATSITSTAAAAGTHADGSHGPAATELVQRCAHGSKVNCMAAGTGAGKGLLFVGDTRKRLCVYKWMPAQEP
jgi:hypothetical protein